MFSHRAAVMKAVPKFLWGSFRIALKLALEEVAARSAANDRLRQERGWKLFLVLPRMLLHHPPRGGLLGKEKLLAQFEKFAAGQWTDLLRASDLCSEQAAVASRRKGRRQESGLDKRVSRALHLVQLGALQWEASIGGCRSGPWHDSHLECIAGPNQASSQTSRGRSTPHRPFELDEVLFSRNLRSAKKGAAGGPSGMTWEHLRPLLDSPRDSRVLFRVAELLARGELPPSIVDVIRVGRLTALRKSNGGVRGIVAGEVIRRLLARTVAQQLGPAVEAATSPFQFVLSTKSGCECVAHCVQALCETHEQLTLTSVDGVSAFDLISRRAMLAGLEGVTGGASVLPFVHFFYGRLSTYLWEDDCGTVHAIDQGEGGEQGDPLMPLLFADGQHPALVATQERLGANEWIFAHLDDIYILSRPERVGAVFAVLQDELLRHAHIRIHGVECCWGAMPSNASQRHLTLLPECGEEQTSPHTAKESGCWELLWDTQTSSEPSDTG